MIKWLKQILRNWLLGEESDVLTDTCLECIVPPTNQKKFYQISGAVGLHLITSDSTGMRLIFKSQACNPQKFQKIWEFYNQGEKFYWEDGKEYQLNP